MSPDRRSDVHTKYLPTGLKPSEKNYCSYYKNNEMEKPIKLYLQRENLADLQLAVGQHPKEV